MIFHNSDSSASVNQVDKEKYKSQFRDLEEHYDEHLNELLPDYLHRGDITSSARLLGYADAMFATCATFLIIPLRNLHHMKKDESLQHYIEHERARFVIFFIGFLVVLTIWENINIRSMIIKRVDDMIIFFDSAIMLCTTVLPFSLALQGLFAGESTPILMSCVAIGVISIFEMVKICYAIESPRLLHVELQQYSKYELRRFRNVLLATPMISLLLMIIGGVFSLLHYAAAWVFIAMYIVVPLIRKMLMFVKRRLANQTKFDKCKFFFIYTKGNISKERVEAMSDAAIAIIACILILDITVESFPTKENVKSNGLKHELEHMAPEFYTFLASFMMVGSLWFVNHTVLTLFRTINVVTLYSQKFFLAFACLCPLSANMLLKFATKDDEDATHAIRYAAVSVLISSMFNLFMLLFGLFKGSKYLEQWAAFECFMENFKQHIYTLLKAIMVPFWSAIVAFSTLGAPNTALYFLYVCFVCMVVSFFLAKFIFMNHIHADARTGENHTPLEMGEQSVEMNKKEIEESNNEKIGNNLYNEQESATNIV